MRWIELAVDRIKYQGWYYSYWYFAFCCHLVSFETLKGLHAYATLA